MQKKFTPYLKDKKSHTHSYIVEIVSVLDVGNDVSRRNINLKSNLSYE